MSRRRNGDWTRRALIGAAAALCALTQTLPAHADSDHKVAWHLARTPSLGPTQVIGGYAAGCLAGGVALPLEGAGYQVMRTDRRRYFGHPVLIDYLKTLGRRAQAAGVPLFNIGDLSQPRGGPMRFGHASHQNGLDVDVWLRFDLPALPRAKRDGLNETSLVDRDTMRVKHPGWTAAHTELLRLAASDARVSRIFVNPAIKLELCRQAGEDRDWLRLIRPWYGHDDHFHVRLNCPADSPQCEPQKPLPPGDGCGSEVMSWLPDARPPDPNRPVVRHAPPNPTLPAACYHVNTAWGLGDQTIQ